MQTNDLLNKLKGVATIETVMRDLGVPRQKAVYYIHRLRKEGYVKTSRQSDKKRVYRISFENRLGGQTYEGMLSDNSPVKLARWEEYFVHRDIPLEEAVVYAIKSKSIRHMLAALGLFRKIRDWKTLYRLAKEGNLTREVGALYDLARTVIRTRRMPKSFLNHSLPKKDSGFRQIISGLRSKDYKNIESKWKVRLPFNRADLEDYA